MGEGEAGRVVTDSEEPRVRCLDPRGARLVGSRLSRQLLPCSLLFPEWTSV